MNEGASSPFHSFKDFNKRINIYSPPFTPISPTLPDTYRTPNFPENEACFIRELKDKDIMLNSCRDFIIDDTPLSNRMGKTILIKKEKFPLIPYPNLEDWINELKLYIHKGAPPSFNKGACPSTFPEN